MSNKERKLKIFLKRKNKILFWIFAVFSVFIMAVIFMFSHQTSLESAQISEGLSGALLNVFESEDSQTWALNFVILRIFIRKFAHVFLFTVLSGCQTFAAINVNTPKKFVKYLVVLLIGLGYAIFDEVHQFFIEGRSSEIIDVVLDFFGVVSGLIFAMIFYKIIQIIAKKYKKS